MADRINFSDCIVNPDALGFGLLAYKNYFKPLQVEKDKWPKEKTAQVELILKQEEGEFGEGEFDLDCVDIVNTETNETLFQLYLYPYGSGSLFANGTTTLIASAAQDGFEFSVVPKSGKERVTAYRLLLDLSSADTSSPFNLIEKLGCNPGEYLDELKEEDIDLTETPGFKKYEKARDARGLAYQPIVKNGQVTLNLNGKRLKKFPLEVCGLSDLTHLNLSNNEIESLPADIGKLKHLKSLNISHNKLTALPREIGELEELEELFVYGSKIISLPEEMARLEKLTTLEFNNSEMESIPKNIGKIPNLKTLSFRNCGLKEISQEIFLLQSLDFLNFNENKISRLPKEVSELTQLTQLMLGENQLEDLPVEFWNMKNLKSVYLQKNNLKVIPDEVRNLDSIVSLTLGYNQIKQIPMALLELKNLESVDYLEENPIENVPIDVVEQGLESIREYMLKGKA
jgi:Leucine-rich repeat (LRR) protein